jgi:hypothetical protein
MSNQKRLITQIITTMKKQILIFFLACLPLLVNADAIEIDGIWYNLVSKVKTAEVTKPATGFFYSGAIEIPDKVNYNGADYSVTSIGNSAFYGCSGLTSITIPNSVTSIGNSAFYGCSGLTSITIPNSVTSIGEYAFSNCRGLTSVTIPNNVTNIENSAFHGCSGLTSITIGSGVTGIGEGAFAGCSGLTSITIPNSVTSIGEVAFLLCRGLTSITIGNGVTSIGSSAFYGCSGLTSITIPNSVTNIDSSAFWGCSGLTSITIGSGVTDIGENAFANCPELTDMTCLAENVPSINGYAFFLTYIEYATLHVPAAAISSYKSMEPWSKFKNIVAIDDETAINNMKWHNNEKDGYWYSLDGRKTLHPAKGIYLRNGKKVFLRLITTQ